jgi:hypothetical protein
MPPMEIKVRFKPDDVARLDREAAAAGTSRAELIRSRALATGEVARLSTADYHRLVAGAAAFMHGDLPARHVESLVAYVISAVHRQAAASPGTAA